MLTESAWQGFQAQTPNMQFNLAGSRMTWGIWWCLRHTQDMKYEETSNMNSAVYWAEMDYRSAVRSVVVKHWWYLHVPVPVRANLILVSDLQHEAMQSSSVQGAGHIQ